MASLKQDSRQADPDQYAFISLGANLPSRFGGPIETLQLALQRLEDLSSEAQVFASSFWQTEPIDCPPGSPPYVNAMAAVLPRDGDNPLRFLHQLQGLERDFGRVRSGLRNEARVLDLDLISFQREQCSTQELILPHPRAIFRRFVLEPLQELAGPHWVLPGQQETIGRQLTGLQDQAISRTKA